MAKRVQRYRVPGSVMATLLGKAGEIIVNTTNNSAHIHDEITPGGFELGLANVSNVQEASVLQDGKMTIAQAIALALATTDTVTNTADIATNTANITTNTGDIATNAAAITPKADKIVPSAVNNIALLSAAGNLVDSGKLITDAGLSATTKATFQQTSAPTGWTKSTTHNNKAFRVISGSVSSGGTNTFTTVFGSGKVTAGTTLTAAQMAHNHETPSCAVGGDTSGQVMQTSAWPHGTVQSRIFRQHSGLSSTGVNNTTLASGPVRAVTASSHNHGLTLDLQYVDMIIATKN